MKKFLTVILSTFLAAAGFSQDAKNSSFSRDNFLAEFVSRTWTAANGLPGNSIQDIIQDSDGYIYLGTYGGLVRFDGVKFLTYNRNYDDKFDFVSARVVFEDKKGNIWSGSNDEGLFRIDETGNVTRWTTQEGLPNNSIRAITEDKDGRIWAGTAGGVAYIQNDTVTVPQGLEKFGAEKVLVTGIYCDTAGRIWILSGKSDGVYIYVNKGFEKFNGLSSFKDEVITCITQDKNTDFWFGVEPHYAVKLEGKEETVFNIGHGKQAGTTVSSIYQDKKGSIWFATDNGVTVIHDGIYSYFDEKNGLSDNKVSKIIEDREGNIWFCTDRGGIERLSRSKFKTTIMPTTVNAIAEDLKRNVFWFAGNNGVYCLDKNTFVENSLTKYCRNIRIRDVYVCQDGTVLVSTYEKLGLVIMTPDGKISSITKENGLTGNKVRCAIQDSKGNILIATTTGLNVVNSNTGDISKITMADGIKNEYIMCLYEDNDGVIWAGTDGGGVFTVKDGKVTDTYTTENGLSGNVIFKISQELPGEYWITTGNGLTRFNPETNSFFNYSSKSGLGSDGVFQCITDYTRTVWMTSNEGIYCTSLDELDEFSKKNGKKINSKFFGQSDGLISAGVTGTSKSMKDSLGRIWFTLIDGFATYDPLNVTANRIAPIIKIEDIIVDNEKLNWHGEKIVLSPAVKRIEITYTGLSFVSSEQTQFASKMEGFENDWSNWSTTRFVSYTNLNPGNYKFEVVASNSDGVLSTNGQSVVIIKKPFIYQRISFWIFIAIFIIGLVAFILNRRFSNMRKYQMELEIAVQERTQALVQEEEKTEQLLLNILPEHVAQILKSGEKETIAHKYKNACVLFTDIVGFTKMAGSLNAEEVVKILNEITSMFDERAKVEGIEKIKTMGDSYMAATGLSDKDDPDTVARMMRFGRGLLEDVREYNKTAKFPLEIRVGINHGNVVAGVIGKSKFIYDIWGDTVNVAFRMEESGKAGMIHVTENTWNETKDLFAYGEPVEFDIKGKGIMKTYYTK